MRDLPSRESRASCSTESSRASSPRRKPGRTGPRRPGSGNAPCRHPARACDRGTWSPMPPKDRHTSHGGVAHRQPRLDAACRVAPLGGPPRARAGSGRGRAGSLGTATVCGYGVRLRRRRRLEDGGRCRAGGSRRRRSRAGARPRAHPIRRRAHPRDQRAALGFRAPAVAAELEDAAISPRADQAARARRFLP